MGITLPGASRPSFIMRLPILRFLLVAISLLVFFTLLSQSDAVADHLRPNFHPPTAVHHTQRPPPKEGASQLTPTQHAGDFKLNCQPEMSHLKEIAQRYKLDSRFQYSKRYVRFTRTAGLKRQSMTHIKQKLIPDKTSFRTIDLSKTPSGSNECLEPLDLPVPESGYPHTVNASDFMFGVSTTYKRFMDQHTSPINEWVFWLTDSRGNSNGGKLLLLLLDATNEQLQEVANLLGDVGIDVDVFKSDSKQEMAVRYLTLVPTLYTHKEAQTKKWLVTCDDDTFFPSMHGLMEKINSYDHTREMYIGTLSEDVGAVGRHGSQAFGGAGVFISLPLAKRITALYSSCTSPQKIRESNTGWGPQGDILLRKCIYENTETRLTNVWDLWQLDILGRPEGFYEWGIKPLSIHHYRGGGWHDAKPGAMAKVALTCGEDCTLMRFQTEDDFIVSGYSVAHYPSGITFDTKQAEGTFHAAPDDYGWNLDFMFGPLRPSLLLTGRKISWELQEAALQSDGSILQTYVRHKNDNRWSKNGKPMSNIDGVIELVWIPSADAAESKSSV
ncbi:Putative Glycosyltransferase family 31 protein [[Torrubiella] hemipterigena]|uniref:Putative Glycosyltransferase family 31 protein n=1 Tax=[Torrubiella] hemipterigena TaxID=1531966 RepID=A0A0A1SN59_9HYPO|nr:Putative Glycosyltransferase family 31 protein [[Torrubiella] hemipterigena]